MKGEATAPCYLRVGGPLSAGMGGGGSAGLPWALPHPGVDRQSLAAGAGLGGTVVGALGHCVYFHRLDPDLLYTLVGKMAPTRRGISIHDT